MSTVSASEPITFGIIGGGWRAEFFLRIAQALPDRFRIGGMVVRDAAKGQALEAAWGVATYRSPPAWRWCSPAGSAQYPR